MGQNRLCVTGTISKLATSFVLKLVKNQTQIGQDTVKQQQTTAEKDETATEYQQPNPWVKSSESHLGSSASLFHFGKWHFQGSVTCVYNQTLKSTFSCVKSNWIVGKCIILVIVSFLSKQFWHLLPYENKFLKLIQSEWTVCSRMIIAQVHFVVRVHNALHTFLSKCLIHSDELICRYLDGSTAILTFWWYH